MLDRREGLSRSKACMARAVNVRSICHRLRAPVYRLGLSANVEVRSHVQLPASPRPRYSTRLGTAFW
jgi:hypothetical protein